MADIVQNKKEAWEKTFRILWAGQAVSIFTSSVIQMAIIWYITDTTKSAAILSLATMVGFLPQAVLGPFIGVLVDRYNRKTIMILSDIFIACMTLVLVISGMKGNLPVWLIMIVLFARSVGVSFHEPSLQAVTPLIVPKEELTKCAGYAQTFESISQLLSPAVAAALYAFLSTNFILLLDVGGAAFAVFTLTRIHIPHLDRTPETHAPNIIREAKEGITALRMEKGMMPLMLISALYAVIYMPIGTLYPLICMSYFGGSFAQSSIVEIVFAAGMLAGSLALGKWGDRIHKMKSIQKSIGVMGIGLFITGLLPPGGFRIFVVLAMMMGITIPFYYGVLTAIFQSSIKPEYLGRVLSLSTSMTLVTMPVGLTLAGTFAEVIGVEKWFFLSGILTIILSVFCSTIPALPGDSKMGEN